jgi:hypothetical protein
MYVIKDSEDTYYFGTLEYPFASKAEAARCLASLPEKKLKLYRRTYSG